MSLSKHDPQAKMPVKMEVTDFPSPAASHHAGAPFGQTHALLQAC